MTYDVMVFCFRWMMHRGLPMDRHWHDAYRDWALNEAKKPKPRKVLP